MMQVRFGDVVVDDVEISTSRPRNLVAQRPARGNGGYVQDGGSDFRVCQVSIQWTKRGRDDDPVARYAALRAIDDGKTRLLVHPLDGAYPAKMSIESENIVRGQVDATVRFVEDRGDPRHVRGPRPVPGMTAPAAIAAVRQRAQTAAEALGSAGMPGNIAADSAALAESWNAPGGPGTADIRAGVQRQTDAIAAVLADSGAESHTEKLDVYFALLDLSATLADAAAVVAASSPSVVQLEIGAPVTVLALAASLYGGEDAEKRADEIMRLNALRSMNAIPAHTTLTVPSV